MFDVLLALLLLFPFTLPAPLLADYTYTTNSGTITITGHHYLVVGAGMGSLGDIPSTINGLPVTGIGDNAFEYSSLTSVTIPNSVTTIGNSAFSDCRSLWEITVDVSNSVYSSVDGVLFNKSRTMLIQCPGEKAGSYTIPNSVTVIVGWA